MRMKTAAAVAYFFLPLVFSSPYSLNKRACENSAEDRSCWGDYDISTNYYETVPDTGVTVEVCFAPITCGLILILKSTG